MNRTHWMYVSQWNLKVGAPGLTLCAFDAGTGEIEVVKQLDDRLSLGCSHIDRARNVLYVVNECDLFPETPMPSGRVHAFRIDPATGELEKLNHKETYCPYTSFVNTDPGGKYLVTSNHSWPSFVTTVEKDENGKIFCKRTANDSLVNLFEINDDGSIGRMVDFYRHPYDGELHLSLLGRPHIPHPHCMMRSPDGKLFACCDKGDGHLYIYAIEDGKLVLKSRTMTDTVHSEPRYCMFHPTKPLLYVNHEHTPGDTLTMTTLRCFADGTVEEIGKTCADLSGFEPKEDPRQMQGMVITPDGRFVYSQAHGYNRILIFSTAGEKLEFIGSEPIRGVWPRSLHVSPDGKFLLNNCLGGDITVYAINADGSLSDTSHHAFIRGAGYISFY